MDTLIVVALESELENIEYEHILYTGIGKVNAAHKLTKYLCEHPNIKNVCNYGSAGGINPNLGGLLKCTKFLQGDIDCRALGTPLTHTPYEQRQQLDFNEEFTDGLTCASFDQFQLEKPIFDTDVVDMEAYALAKVCFLMDKHFTAYKWVSDIVGGTNQSQQWKENYQNGQELFKAVFKVDYGIEL